MRRQRPPPPDASAARVCVGRAETAAVCVAGPKPPSRRREVEQPRGEIILPSKIPIII
jgi:hypothetical protein